VPRLHAVCTLALALAALPVLAQNVKITPVGSRAAAVVKALKGSVSHLAISGRTMEFDGKGTCVSGC
jgi:hypothetical protein